MVDALALNGDEGRSVATIRLGEVRSNLWSGDVRMGKPSAANQHCQCFALTCGLMLIRHATCRRGLMLMNFIIRINQLKSA